MGTLTGGVACGNNVKFCGGSVNRCGAVVWRNEIRYREEKWRKGGGMRAEGGSNEVARCART